jgi:N-acyl-L-homoserine lactone synthetase
MIAHKNHLELIARSAVVLPDRATELQLLPESRQRTRERATGQELVTALAHTQADIHAALRMVYEAYLETGLIGENPFAMRVTPYHVLPTTNVFVASRDEQLVGTLSLVRDCALGLPMEDVYSAEVNSRRACGKSVAEVTCLADSSHGKSNMLSVVIQLMSHMAQFARRQGVDELLIAVHPHHVGFYERFIGFEVIGHEKRYAAVQDNPAVALALDLNRLSVNHPRAYQRFFGKPFADGELQAHRMDSATIALLLRVLNQTEWKPTEARSESLLSAA